jgi:hypothetical protein
MRSTARRRGSRVQLEAKSKALARQRELSSAIRISQTTPAKDASHKASAIIRKIRNATLHEPVAWPMAATRFLVKETIRRCRIAGQSRSNPAIPPGPGSAVSRPFRTNRKALLKQPRLNGISQRLPSPLESLPNLLRPAAFRRASFVRGPGELAVRAILAESSGRMLEFMTHDLQGCAT